jgi:Gram-negative bacterial TonB protein C-terminal
MKAICQGDSLREDVFGESGDVTAVATSPVTPGGGHLSGGCVREAPMNTIEIHEPEVAEKTGAASRPAAAVLPRKELTVPAIAAVKQWRYKPYLLNGQPVEVETQVTVIFQFSH